MSNNEKTWTGKKPFEDDKPFPQPNPVVGKCPKCGLELHQMMHYVCSRNGCPVFTQVTCSA